jgi:methylase of polypeptide subunit release factors
VRSKYGKRVQQTLSVARDRDLQYVEFEERDFLAGDMLDVGRFEYIVGNPPYVPIEGLNGEEKQRYKATFDTAIGRFDLYLLFFERSSRMWMEANCQKAANGFYRLQSRVLEDLPVPVEWSETFQATL